MQQTLSLTEDAYVSLAIRIARMCQTAGSVVILYDHVLQFGQEVDYVWNCSFNLGSLNYVLIRYFGSALAILNMMNFLGGIHTQQLCVFFHYYHLITFAVSTLNTCHSCRVYFFVQSWLGVLVLLLIQVMLQARLYALYRESKTILALMISGFVCEIAAMVTILALVDAGSYITNEIIPGVPICADIHGPSFFQPYVLWLPVVLYDSILCFLSAWRGVRNWMQEYNTKPLDGVCIADVLIRDSVGYFLCILLACIVCAVIAQCLGLLWLKVSEEFPAPMEVVVGCRLFLNLRSSLAQDHADEKEDDSMQEEIAWRVVLPLPTP